MPIRNPRRLVLSLGGDLGGNLPAPLVTGLRGLPLSATAPTLGQFIGYNGTEWAPTTAPSGSFTAGGDLSGSNTSQTVVGLQGYALSATPPNPGDFLQWTGADWAPAAAPGGSFTAGGDLSGTNTNQTVVGLINIPIFGTPTNGQTLVYNSGMTRLDWATVGGGSGPTYAEGRWGRLPGRDLQALPWQSDARDPAYDALDTGSTTFGPNASWGGVSLGAYSWQLQDFCDWVGLGGLDPSTADSYGGGLAVIAYTTGGGNAVFFISNRATGTFWIDNASAFRSAVKMADVAALTGSTGWTYIEAVATSYLLIVNTTTFQVARLTSGGSLLEAALTLGAASISKPFHDPGSGFAFIVSDGVLYKLTVTGGGGTLASASIAGLPAGVTCDTMTSDGTYLYVPDAANSQIHIIDLATQTYVSSITTPSPPQCVVYDGTNFWFTNTSLWPTLRVISPSGTTIKNFGTGWTGGFGNNYQGHFDGRYVYFAGIFNSQGIRRIDPESYQVKQLSVLSGMLRLRSFMDGGTTSDLWVLGYNFVMRAATTRELVRAHHVRVQRTIGVRARSEGANFGGGAIEVDLNDKANSLLEINTRSNSATIWLPRRPIDGMEVVIHDSYGNAAANNITINSSMTYAGNAGAEITWTGSNYQLFDPLVQNSDFRSTGIYHNDLLIITAGPGAGNIYRIGVFTSIGTTTVALNQIFGTVTTGTGITYKMHEQLQTWSGGVVSLGTQDVINTNFGFRRYHYTRGLGWMLHDAR